MLLRAVIAAALIGISATAHAEPENTRWPNYKEGDFTITDYKFANGQILPQLKLHYRTLGTAQRNAAGEITTAYCYCKAIPALAPIGYARVWPMSCSKTASLWMPDVISSSSPMRWVAAARANLPTGLRATFRTIVITTWSTACTGLSRRGSKSLICAS